MTEGKLTMTNEEIVEELRCILDAIIQGHGHGEGVMRRIMAADYKLRPSDEEEGDLGGEWRLALSSPDCACEGRKVLKSFDAWFSPTMAIDSYLEGLYASDRKLPGMKLVRIIVLEEEARNAEG